MSATVVENSKEVTTAQSLAGKYLTFALGNEEYGERVHKVREIIGMMDVTPSRRFHHMSKVLSICAGRSFPWWTCG